MRICTTAFATALLWIVPAMAEERSEIRTYNVRHALFGDIGSISDEVTQDGDRTRVVTRADVRVDVLGMTLHHLRFEWIETWQNGMLSEYRATTTRNGRSESVSGRHQDGRFIIRAGEEKFDAPPDVQPVHPWSIQFVRAAVLMSPESGRLFPADITDKGFRLVSIEGTERRLRHYVARSDTTNHLYFDEDGRLLCAEYRDITGKVSFTLKSGNAPRVASVR